MRFKLGWVTLSLALSIKSIWGANLPAQAQFQSIVSLGNEPILLAQRRLRFRVPSVRASGNLQAASARWKCSPDGISLTMTPLLPSTQSDGEVYVYPGTTLSAHPQFFVHLPKTTAQEAHFKVVNQNGEQVVYQEIMTLPESAGVVEFSVPETAAPLEVNQTYQWSVELICDPLSDRGRNIMIEGVVQRVEASERLTAIDRMAESDRAFAYAEADIWYDALTEIAQLRCNQPYNSQVASDWKDLLTSVNLGAIADEPLVSCNNPQRFVYARGGQH